MEASITSSGLYDSLSGQDNDLEYSATGGYYPPNTGNSGFYSNQSGFEVAGSTIQPNHPVHPHDSIASLPASKFYPAMNAHLNAPGNAQQVGHMGGGGGGDGDTNPMWTGTASV
ncbi:hypothetical protein EON65_14305 [archaeon]|nr:MAG: hypothetical protein EON65_14305 [archaeon]